MKMQANDMLTAADEASAMLKALANRHRLIVICQLIEKERSVGELAALLKIRHSTVSQHLALLRKDGLVNARRDGQTIWYSIGSSPARELVQTRAVPATALTIYAILRIYAAMKIQVKEMQAAADHASTLLKALANRHRLIIVCQRPRTNARSANWRNS